MHKSEVVSGIFYGPEFRCVTHVNLQSIKRYYERNPQAVFLDKKSRSKVASNKICTQGCN